jgi:signal transduction histidine kinase
LAGGIAHELRNPLGAISNAAYFLGIVLDKSGPKAEDALEILKREVKTCDKIINSLLDFARGKPPVRRKVNLNDVIQAALFRAAIPESIRVVIRLDEALPTVQADPDQLSQVLSNLILNAVQAMTVLGSDQTFEGGQLTVKSQVLSPEWVSVSFTDAGVGIAPENLEKLFEPLFTTKPDGIGLGLAITKSLVEGHGGSIEVQSIVGQGSTFAVKLPTC